MNCKMIYLLFCFKIQYVQDKNYLSKINKVKINKVKKYVLLIRYHELIITIKFSIILQSFLSLK